MYLTQPMARGGQGDPRDNPKPPRGGPVGGRNTDTTSNGRPNGTNFDPGRCSPVDRRRAAPARASRPNAPGAAGAWRRRHPVPRDRACPSRGRRAAAGGSDEWPVRRGNGDRLARATPVMAGRGSPAPAAGRCRATATYAWRPHSVNRGAAPRPEADVRYTRAAGARRRRRPRSQLYPGRPTLGRDRRAEGILTEFVGGRRGAGCPT